MLRKRDEVYKAAKEKRPERWSRDTRNWTRIDQVALNSTADAVRNAGKDEKRQLP